MAITVRHDPNFVDYGQAIAMAAQQTESANRMQDYAKFLGQMQAQNQQYRLGLGALDIDYGKLGEEQKRTGLESRKLDLEQFRNALAQDELNWKIKLSENEALAQMMTATGSFWSGIGSAVQAHR